MNWLNVWRRQRVLAQCAPFSEARLSDRAMRMAVFRAQKKRQTAEGFTRQQAFDSAIAALVRAIPVPAETAEWFVNESLVASGKKRAWKKTAGHPAIGAIALAVAVILGIGLHMLLQRLADFPGSVNARKLL